MKTLSLVFVLFIAALTALRAQSDTITANPNAVRLRRIWYVHGAPAGLSYVGDGVGDVGDVNGDSIDDFAVHYRGEQRWKIFYGAYPRPADTPAWQYRIQYTKSAPILGDFWGTGHKAIVFGEVVHINNCCNRVLLNIFRMESGHIGDVPDIKQDTLQLPNGGSPNTGQQILAFDLDNDGADELIVVGTSTWGSTTWIYRGGSNFQVDSPAVVINDYGGELADVGLTVIAGDFDKDGYPDLITGGKYPNGEKMKFYWGGPGAPWKWSLPDRIITHDATMPGFSPAYGLLSYDCDGDKIPDIQIGANCIFRSKTGKDIRIRPFTFTDVDNNLQSKSIVLEQPAGHLNDSSRRYEMTGALSGDLGLLAFSGSDGGPSVQYVANYNDVADVGEYALGIGGGIGDVSGDGWTDYLGGNSGGNGLSDGAAVVLAGGPYIPRDSLMSAIRDYEVQGKARAISVWPMPAHDEVHIAWRGDLPQMPTRFEVYNALGQRVAGGVITEEKGEALWRCQGMPAGCYYVSIYSRNNSFVATVPILKQ